MPDGNSPESASEPVRQTVASEGKPEADAQIASSAPAKPAEKRPLWMWIAGGVLGVLILIEGIPRIITAFKTVSTDDAYVNGHVTFVAPRVPGQVVRVLVDDNNRLHKGDLLVQLDKEPYQVKVDIARARLAVAQADLVQAQAKVRGLAGLARSEWFELALLRNEGGSVGTSVAQIIEERREQFHTLRLNESLDKLNPAEGGCFVRCCARNGGSKTEIPARDQNRSQPS